MPLGLSAELINLKLEELRQQFKAGDKAALLKAVRFCGNEQVIMPEWVVTAFFKATNRWYAMDVKTLDEAFGVQFPKGKHFNAARKRRMLEFQVYDRVTDLHRAGAAIDDSLFEAVGREFYMGKTLAKEYYDAVKTLMHAAPSATARALLEPYRRKK